MGRIIELITDVAAAADEQGSKLSLPMEAWDQLRDDWGDDEIGDALTLAQATFEQQAVSDAADAVSARVIDILSAFADEKEFQKVVNGESAISLTALSSLMRGVDYLEEMLDVVRDAPGPERKDFDRLKKRMADVGIETEMAAGKASDDAIRERSPRFVDRDEDEDYDRS